MRALTTTAIICVALSCGAFCVRGCMHDDALHDIEMADRGYQFQCTPKVEARCEWVKSKTEVGTKDGK